jgi:hypothetical protein
MGDAAEKIDEPKADAAKVDTMVQVVGDLLDPRFAVKTSESWDLSIWYWKQLITSGVLPKHVRTPEQAIAIAEAGRVRGWSAMLSLEMLCLIEGVISMRSKAMWSEILKFCRANKDNGIRVRPVERSLKRAAIQVWRPDVFGDEPFEYEFTQEDASTAKLWGKTNKSGSDSPWILYPKAMLWARVVGIVGRDAFGEVIHGLYTSEEMEDLAAQPQGMATVTQMPRPATTSLDDLAARASGAVPTATRSDADHDTGGSDDSAR